MQCHNHDDERLDDQIPNSKQLTIITPNVNEEFSLNNNIKTEQEKWLLRNIFETNSSIKINQNTTNQLIMNDETILIDEAILIGEAILINETILVDETTQIDELRYFGY